MSKKPNRTIQYKLANEEFLEQKAQEEGIIALESGILMRQPEKGTGGSRPQLNSIVFVNYTGRLIDGTVFDTTDGQDLPAYFRVREVIVGWQAFRLCSGRDGCDLSCGWRHFTFSRGFLGIDVFGYIIFIKQEHL